MRADAVQRRQAIIDAACEVFRTVPSKDITLTLIAKKAGVGIATLYRNFPTRTHLNIACGLDLLDQLDRAIDTLDKEFDADPEETLDTFVWALVHNGIGTLVAVLVPDDPDAIPQEVINKRAELLEKMDTFLTRAATQGLVPPNLKAEQLAAELFVVTRPQSHTLSLIDPTVRDRLVSRLLFCWKNQH